MRVSRKSIIGRSLWSIIVLSPFVATAQTPQPVGESGKVELGLWTGVAGNHIEKTWGLAKYYQGADITSELTLLKAPSNAADSFSQRMRGYIVAPVTGEYKFWASGDDHFALWLSPDDDKFNAQKIIHVKSYTSAEQIGKYRSQQSKTISLVAGTRYYIEAQSADGNGSDHLDIKWSYTSGALSNWSLESGAIATQSTTGWGGLASLAIDGNTNGDYSNNSTTHTQGGIGSWWKVDLAGVKQIDRVELYNREGYYGRRLGNFRVSVLDSTGAVVASQDYYTAGGYAEAAEYWETGGVQGSAVKVEILGANVINQQYLSLAEVKVLGRSDTNQTYQSIQTIGAGVLQKYAGNNNDQDDDRLRDDWEAANGFDITQYQGGDKAPFSDSDRDGFSVLRESELGLTHNSPDSVDGYFTMERWNSVFKYNVSDLVRDDVFYAEPSVREAVQTTSFKDLGEYSGARLRGYITAPVSGNYRFWISSRNGSELWLSNDATKFKKQKIAFMGPEYGTGHGIASTSSNFWDVYSSQMSKNVYLEAGEKYFVEMLTQQGHGGAYHVSVAWAKPGQAREALPLNVVSSFGVLSDDLDDDYLPDTWESQYGLSVTDNGGVDRSREGELGDFDNDGLSNREEYLAGTDPSKRDTDGDGMFDGDELRNNTDPTAIDAPLFVLSETINIDSFTNVLGDWNPSTKGLVSDTVKSAISWDFVVPSSGVWMIQLETEVEQESNSSEAVPVKILIDGQVVADVMIQHRDEVSSLTNILTQSLSPGTHTVKVEINNILAHRRIFIDSIKLMKPEGVDADGNGQPDWLDAELGRRNYVYGYPASSLVSPAFFEGYSENRASATLNGSPVLFGLDKNHFYGNLDLNATSATPLNIALGNAPDVVDNITWGVTNLHSRDIIYLRKDDKLKLGSTPINGATGSAVSLNVSELSAFTIFEDFQGADYGLWVATGEAFGTAPAANSDNTAFSWNAANGKMAHSYISAGNTESKLGKLVSPDFTISNKYVHFRIAGGNYPEATRIRLLDAVTGEQFRLSTGHNSNSARDAIWDVTDLQGKSVKIEIEDNHTGAYGWIMCDHISFSDNPKPPLVDSGIVSVDYQLATDSDYQVHQFSEAGVYKVSSTSAGTNAELTVVVRKAELPLTTQDLVLNNIGSLELDRTKFSYNTYFDGGKSIDFIGKKLTASKLNVYLAARRVGNTHLAFRSYQNGPIMATQGINIFDVSGSFRNESLETTQSISPDHYLITSPVTMNGLPQGGSVKLEIFRAGVTFADGSKVKVLTEADFTNGVYKAQYLYPKHFSGGFCHKYSYYDRYGNQL